ncbi:hypothetical protein KEM48_014536 [Puccinia striiformis f. sp. tritici PST-130]|nr:hypothetical protein KEM48_014536 [Puccinia striiformis f. sp. tritici PST-130]
MPRLRHAKANKHLSRRSGVPLANGGAIHHRAQFLPAPTHPIPSGLEIRTPMNFVRTNTLLLSRPEGGFSSAKKAPRNEEAKEAEGEACRLKQHKIKLNHHHQRRTTFLNPNRNNKVKPKIQRIASPRNPSNEKHDNSPSPPKAAPLTASKESLRTTLKTVDKEADPPPLESKVDCCSHNEIRARYSTPPLKWSSKLEASAQVWADRCVFEHSGGPFGENIAAGQRRLNQLSKIGSLARKNATFTKSDQPYFRILPR